MGDFNAVPAYAWDPDVYKDKGLPNEDKEDNSSILDSTHHLQSMDADMTNEFKGEDNNDDNSTDVNLVCSLHSNNDDHHLEGEAISTLADNLTQLAVQEASFNIDLSNSRSDPHSIWRQNNNMLRSLPPMSTLLELVDRAPYNNDMDSPLNNGVDPAFKIWSVAAGALCPNVVSRDTFEMTACRCEAFDISPKELCLLDRN
ncbi:hypothetical protein M422DRAFT_259307 [Sphaerobolus stellatus SS14]|uniref:Unplaced genomic scaffold SPHSTscaffold_88, whole genome shotgun sequence n=1 Tax=Sphaerobolus stellatus (strain SS14) TaxID=990650 RepID=A0A0C9UTE4_SPHS4|nr:hypothetical protein M422DRAFT_259307 [Sphaerobolus stellatus SS14]